MPVSRPTNTDIHRTLGRLEAQLEGLTAALATHNEGTSRTAKEVLDLRDDVRDLSRDMKTLNESIEPIREQTEWLKTKRAEGVGFIAAFSIGVAFIASALGAVGTRAWALLVGDA